MVPGPVAGPGRADRAARRSHVALVYVAALTVFVVDRVTKLWAEGSLRGHRPIVLIRGVLDLSYTTNSGGAFSVFTNAPWLFFGASVVISAGIVWLSFRVTSATAAAGLGLILGGAIGNLTDRLTRGSGVSGQVVDFVHLHLWPTFNLADSSIVVGAIVVLSAGLFGAAREGRGATPA